eukprot:279063-Rhodomonas_salina.3
MLVPVVGHAYGTQYCKCVPVHVLLVQNSVTRVLRLQRSTRVCISGIRDRAAGSRLRSSVL